MNLFENLRKFAKTDKIAAVWHDEELSYKDLNIESDALALWLEKNYPQRDLPVAIWGDKENSALTAIYGSIKGGHAYVFLPWYYPQPRLEQILQDSRAQVMIVCSDLPCPFIGREGLQIVNANHACPIRESVKEFIGKEPSEELCVGDDEYVGYFYTSGSTGIPKIVGVTGKNIKEKIHQTLKDDQGRYFDTDMRLLDPINYAFAMSIQVLFFDHATIGSTTYAVDISMLRDFPSMMQLIFDNKINQLGGTSTLLNYMMQHPMFNQKDFPVLKTMALGGEVVTRSLLHEFFKRYPNVPLLISFGATETCSGPLSVFLTKKTLEDNPDMEIMPIASVSQSGNIVKLVDENGNPVEEGEIGEFWFEGDFVTPGYLNDPELTSKKFYTTVDGKRGYKTGDLGYYKNDYYFFTGRINNMYKIGGYRVEMEDVENAIRQVDFVQNCAVTPVMDGESAVMLAAYVVLKKEMKQLEATLTIKDFVSSIRPEYMIPQKIVYVDALPVNAHNKLDRQKLLKQEKIN